MQLVPHCVSAPQLEPHLVPSHVGVLPVGPAGHAEQELSPQLVTKRLLTHVPEHRC